MITLADLEVHVPIKSSCVVAEAVLLSNAAVLRSNVLRSTIANRCSPSKTKCALQAVTLPMDQIEFQINPGMNIGAISEEMNI